MKKEKDIKTILKYIIVVVCVLSFIFIVLNLKNNNIERFDRSFYDVIIKMKSNTMTSVFKSITFLSSATFIAITILALFFVIKDKNYPIAIFLNTVGIAAINKIAKYIFSRQRPIGLHLIEETGLSFPSRAFNDKFCFLWLCYIFNI